MDNLSHFFNLLIHKGCSDSLDQIARQMVYISRWASPVFGRSVLSDVTCSKCGAPRPPELSVTTERPPCPDCGSTALTFSVTVEESISISDHCSAELVPGNQTRDWKQRWKLILGDIQLISSPEMAAMSGESIHAALQRLFAFFILAYHLKDALKEAAHQLGLKSSDIEDAITNDPRLALLADLANLDKHMKLTKPPRSGCTPVVEKISGADSTNGSGWRLVVRIKHGSSTLDGLAVARDAIAAWQEKLTAWGIA